MISHKLITAVIFTSIVGGLAKSSHTDEEFLHRLSKLTLSDIKSEYQIRESVQRYNGSQLMPVNSYKLALFPPFFIDVIYSPGRRQPITQNEASEGTTNMFE